MNQRRLMIPKPQSSRHYVREWRKFRGLTQEQLAERTPFTAGAISQLETGRTRYTQEMLEALAVALDCRPGDLLNRDPNKAGDVVDLFDGMSDDDRRRAILMIEALKSA